MSHHHHHHHHHEKEKPIVEEKTKLQRRHSGSSTHSKTTSVFDHLKTKYRQKRLSKHDSLDLSDSTSIQSDNTNTNNNNNNNSNTMKRSSHEQIEPVRYRTSKADDSHSPVLSTIFSYDGTESEMNANNQVFIENDEQYQFLSTIITDHNNKEANVQYQTNDPPIISDTDQKISQSKPKLKLKPIKSTKSLPISNNSLNVKKRRQTVRRTGFQIRDEDFRLIFSDLPSDEQLIIGYPCSWRKDVFMHGRMFLSVNYFCFYTCFFKWEESLCIAYKDIISITRKSSAKLIPNAIQIRTNNEENYFFVSTIPREKIFISVFRLWQNALLEKPLNYQQLRAIIFMDQQTLDESSGESEESITLENAVPDTAVHSLLTQSLPVTSDRSVELSRQPIKTTRRIKSLPPHNENPTYLSSCNCESHLAKTYADRLFTLNVDTLFELLFGDNSFTRHFHNAQKLTDYNYGEWHLNKDTGHRERQVTYKTVTQSILGTNSLLCREKQTLEVEKANLIYVLSSEVHNEGMKYTDTFYVATRFCMIQRDSEHSSLRATAEVKYVKNVNGFIKTFIEKNAYSSIEDGINEQVRRLENQQVNIKPHKKLQSTSKQNSSMDIPNEIPNKSDSNISIKEKPMIDKGNFYNIALFIGIFILLLHIYLCYKLYYFDQNVSTLDGICLKQCIKTCRNG